MSFATAEYPARYRMPLGFVGSWVIQTPSTALRGDTDPPPVESGIARLRQRLAVLSCSMHGNERSIRDLYDAMARGDGRQLARALTAETQWIMPGRGSLSGTYTGPAEIFGLWKRIAEQSGGGLQLELRDVLANDDHAVALVTVRGRRGDRQLDQRQVAVFEFTGGALSSGTFIYEDPEAYDEFWH